MKKIIETYERLKKSIPTNTSLLEYIDNSLRLIPLDRVPLRESTTREIDFWLDVRLMVMNNK